MGRIVVLDNPLDPKAAREYSHSGPYIDFLVDRYPEGFPGAHVTAFNLDHLRVEDYDKVVGPDDTVVLGLHPGIFGLGPIMAAVVTALIGAVVSVALNFVINKFFGPKGTKPKDPVSSSEDSPSYSLNTPTNVARIGQPIPVAYGRNLIVPDLASTPYKFFSNNNEYIALMFCLGMGEYEVHEVLVGDTPVATLAPGVIPDLRVWSPWDHGQMFGYLQDTIGWSSGFRENMYVSPEVSDQELIAVATGATQTEPRTYTGTGTLYNAEGATQGSFVLDTEAPTNMIGPPAGTNLWVRVSNSGSNDGVYQVVSFWPDPGVVAQTLGPKYGQIQGGVYWEVPNATATIELSYDSSFSDIDSYTGPGTKIGPFNVGGREVLTDIIYCDVTLPALYSTDTTDGSLLPYGVGILFRSELLDENDNVISQSGEIYHHFEAATRSPIKQTLAWAVPYGRHRVWGRRETFKGTTITESSVYWVGLRGNSGNPFLTATNNLTYEHTTLITVIAKASEGLASDALSRFSVDCTRKLELADGSKWVTRNPAAAFRDAFTNTRYGGGRPEAELDSATLDALGAEWDQVKFFDAVFDQPSTLWEVLGLILQMQHAAPTMIGSVVSIVEDVNHSVGTFALTEDTITNLSMTYLFSDGDEPDGVEGEYRDPRDNAALYVCWPTAAVNPEAVTLWGCRDYNTALAYVQQRWNQLVYRRRLIHLETELEGHVLVVGQPVTVRHPLLGDDPVLCVVNAVSPKEEFSVSVDLHIHQPEVYA